MEKNTQYFGRKTVKEDIAKSLKNEGKVPAKVTLREDKTSEKRDFAAGFVMAAGCMALILFLIFGAFGKNAKVIGNSNSAIDEYNGAISVFSQIIYPDGKIERSDKTPFDTSYYSDNSKNGNGYYANAENTFSYETDGFNFWQYLCDSLAMIFGITNAE